MIPSPPTRVRADLAETRRLAAAHEAENSRLEAPHRAAFDAFYRGLERRSGTWFMFFTGDLLHWVVRCLSFLPDEVPVALVGSGLEAEEVALAARLGPPFHHIELAVDDNTPLDFLAAVADEDFGWLHIDCFVLNPGLLEEMATPAADAALSCLWTSTDRWGDVVVPHSALIYVRQWALQAIRERGWRATPRAFCYENSRRGRFAPRDSARALVPTEDELAALTRQVPKGPSGLPSLPPGHDYFPAFSVLAALASDLGLGLERVRRLDRGSGSLFDQYSDEVVHVSGVGTYRRVYEQRAASEPDLPLVRFYPQLLQMDHAALVAAEASADGLPVLYQRRRAELEAELERLDLDPESTAQNTFEFLVAHGLRGDTAIRLLAS